MNAMFTGFRLDFAIGVSPACLKQHRSPSGTFFMSLDRDLRLPVLCPKAERKNNHRARQCSKLVTVFMDAYDLLTALQNAEPDLLIPAVQKAVRNADSRRNQQNGGNGGSLADQ